MEIHASPRQLDHGRAFAVRPDGHPGFALEMRACATPRCTCTEVMLALYPRAIFTGDDADDADDVEPVSLRFDVRTREVRAVSDPGGWLAAPVDESWLRRALAGETGDRIVARFDRTRASHDRRTWQQFAWNARRPSEMVAYFELFPHDWDLLVQPGEHAAWLVDSYCVEPSCACQDVAVSVRSHEGAALGDAVLRLSGKRHVRVVRCAPGAAPFVERLIEDESSALHRRFAEMRGVARRLKTWPQDLADPAATVETLLARRKELAPDELDRIHALGGRVVAQLAAAVQDPAASDLRRRRAAQLLAATDEPAAVDALASAVRWADPADDPDLFDDLLNALNALREPSLAALLAALPSATGDAERDRVAFALADLRIADPRVLELLAERVRREPDRWLDHLRWQGDAAVPVVREALAMALGALPERLDDALEAIDVLERLGAAIDASDRASIERVKQDAAAAKAAARAQAAAAAKAARAELAELDRRARTGRNQPCWCGSGQKYKKCHLAADETARAEIVRRTLD